MNFLDVFVVILILGATALEAFRGFGRAIFDALALYAVLWVASAAAGPLSGVIPMSAEKGPNLAISYSLVAVIGSILALVIAHYTYNATLPHAGMFDPFLGLVLGVAVGVMFSHCLVRGIALSDPSSDGNGAMVSAGVVSGEVYDFHTYHTVVDQITGAANYHRELTLGN